MANELGLSNTLGERLVRPFWKYRGDEARAGRPITFETFMRTRPDGGEIIRNAKTKEPLTWKDLYAEMGKDPYDIFLNALATRDDDFKYLFGPMIEDAFVKGFITTSDNRPPVWKQLCCETDIPTANDYLARTWLQFNGTPTATAEGETFPEARISNGQETVSWCKKGLNLHLTVEYLRATPLPVLERWIAEIGRIYQYQENNLCARTLIDGDLKNSGNAAPIVGVIDPTKGFQYEDFLNAWNLGDYIGEKWFTMVAGLRSGNKIGLIPEFKLRYLGTPIVKIANSPEPGQMDRFVNQEVSDGQIIFVDTSHALRHRTFFPINIRNSSFPENWTEGLTIGYSTTFERVGDKACFILDESLSFADHGFPSWFTIGGVRPYSEAA